MAWKVGCQGSGTDKRCMFKFKHDHCSCGLVMAVGDGQCALCILEGTVPMEVESRIVWDGKTYPSWRNHRTRGHYDSYQLLAQAIGDIRTPRDYALIKGRRIG